VSNQAKDKLAIPAKDNEAALKSVMEEYENDLIFDANGDKDKLARVPKQLETGRANMRKAMAAGKLFGSPKYANIYVRYLEDIPSYLKSQGAKQVTDDKGFSWWAVPVKPEQRRTQMFGMGGAVVAGGGAAAYNAQDAEATGAQ
jgi:hypothetical protein